MAIRRVLGHLEQNPCAWRGVVCSTNFTVVELDFSGWEEGPISLQPLARLRDLRSLSSSFLDYIPEDIGSLTGLIRLDLSRNGLASAMPASISNCTGLRYLSLEQNYLSGEISSLRELVNLQILNLADNLFVDQFPKDLLELSSLVSIDLSRNQLQGSIPSLSKLTNLDDLILDGNNFTKFEESWLPPPNLKSFSVSENLLDGMIPPSIMKSTTLFTINMSCNQLSSVPSESLRSERPGTGLFVVDLSHNQLSGNVLHNILPDFSMNTSIALNLSHNRLTGTIPVDGAKRLFYVFLDLSYNQLSRIIPEFFSNNETYIYSLQLQHNNLSGDIVDVLNGIGASSDLAELRLGNNLLSGDLSRIMPVGDCSRYVLEVVDLSNNNLQMSTRETNPDPLRAVLECFMQSNYFKEFRMAGNNFSGISLSRELNHIEQARRLLTIIDLSNTQLKGEIYGNAFAGTSLPNLQYLNLSNNDLVGPVPEDVVNLPTLTVFDVADNSLSGPLPSILPNSSLYNPSSFQGNSGLCGDPLPACSRPGKWWV